MISENPEGFSGIRLSSFHGFRGKAYLYLPFYDNLHPKGTSSLWSGRIFLHSHNHIDYNTRKKIKTWVEADSKIYEATYPDASHASAREGKG